MASKETVTLTLDIPDSWIADNFSTDLFRRNCIGYWARGLERVESGAWLLWEHDDTRMSRDHEDTIVRAFERYAINVAQATAAELGYNPAHFHVLSRDAMRRVYAECVRLYGEREAIAVDASCLDVAVQRVLFGCERYG